MILVVISLYHSFLVSFFPILRMTITLYIYSVHEGIRKIMNEKTIIYQFEEFSCFILVLRFFEQTKMVYFYLGNRSSFFCFNLMFILL